jgi:hypothetical protein
MAQHKREPGPPMDLANMRRNGVPGPSIACLNHTCRHELIFSADNYSGDTELSRSRMVCSKCGGKRVDVRPNWNEASPVEDWRGNEAMPGGE